MVEMHTPPGVIGWVAPNFHLENVVDGKMYSLHDCMGPKGLLVMFICNHCPYVKSIIEKLVHDLRVLSNDYGINSVAIMPNDTNEYPEDSYENMVEFAKKHGFNFPYLIDTSQNVAKSYGAVCTPDFFGFNSDLKLCYRGRFDSSKREHIQNTQEEHELFKAMQLVSETSKGPEIQLPSVGCSIKWKKSMDNSTNA